MENDKPFESNYVNACKVIDKAYKCAKHYREIHFWEEPNEDTFNDRLCRELGLPSTGKSVTRILVIVDEWNVHKILKGFCIIKYPSVLQQWARKTATYFCTTRVYTMEPLQKSHQFVSTMENN